MATKMLVNGKETSIPDVYSSIKSGIRNPVTPTSYGNVCIIDIGMGSGYVGGAGINGAQTSGADSIYFLSNLAEYQNFTRGGNYWALSELLFTPGGRSNNLIGGTSGVYFIKAATTAPATKQATLSTQTITFKTKDEGLVCNGVLTSGNLTSGYSFKIFSSPNNAGKYFITFYVASYKGTDALPTAFTANSLTAYTFPTNPLPLDGISAVDAVPTILYTTDEFSSMSELITILNNSNNFNAMFSYVTVAVPSTIAISVAEITALSGYQLFVGGTESYSSADFDNVLSQISELDNTFFLAPHSAENALSIFNTKLLYHITFQARFEKFLYVGGGNLKNKFKGSSDATYEVAVNYNSDRVRVIHGGYKENIPFSKTPISKSSFYSAVKMLGRVSGLLPYNSSTYKKIRVDGLLHNLSRDEQEIAIKGGVSYFINDPQLGFCIAHDSNTLQVNSYLINEDATSYSETVKRILAQISKLVVIEAKRTFFGREEGSNRFNTSPEDVIAWTRGFLENYKAKDTADNYLLRVGNINAVSEQDNLRVTYESVPNGPINKMLFTNIILSA